jgi:hypothetical protein
LTIPIAILAVLNSCTASWYLNRAVAKDPSILQQRVVKMDTTIITPERIVHDTIVTTAVDTIELVRDRVRIQLVRNYDTIAVNVECPSDTIRVVQTASFDNMCPPKPYDWTKWLGWLIALMSALFIVRRLRI